MSTDIGVWVAGLLTLATYSYLYKENPAYRLAEYLVVGVGAGYTLALGWQNITAKAIQPIQQGRYLSLLPLLLGVLLFTKLSQKQSWIARYPMAIMVSLGVAVSVRGAVSANLTRQIGATMLPLTSTNNILMVLGTATVLGYFFFTFPANKALTYGSRVGQMFLMVAFGAMIGSVVMLRIAILISRITFVFGDWWGILK